MVARGRAASYLSKTVSRKPLAAPAFFRAVLAMAGMALGRVETAAPIEPPAVDGLPSQAEFRLYDSIWHMLRYGHLRVNMWIS